MASNSVATIASIGSAIGLHADFGAGFWGPGPIGIPITVVDGQTTPTYQVPFVYADQSDPGPYPIPPDVAIEGGPNSTGDRHAIIVDRQACRLYELYALYPDGNGWTAGSGAIRRRRLTKLAGDPRSSRRRIRVCARPGRSRNARSRVRILLV
jgi:hypothetical protein